MKELVKNIFGPPDLPKPINHSFDLNVNNMKDATSDEFNAKVNDWNRQYNDKYNGGRQDVPFLHNVPYVPSNVPYYKVSDSKIFYPGAKNYTKVYQDNQYKHSDIKRDYAADIRKQLNDKPVYAVKGKDFADWAYNRAGIELNPSNLSRAINARKGSQSQLSPAARTIYYGNARPSVDSFSDSLNRPEVNNQYFNAINTDESVHEYFSDPRYPDTYENSPQYNAHDYMLDHNGYINAKDVQGKLPGVQLYKLQEMQDHLGTRALNHVSPSDNHRDMFSVFGNQRNNMRDKYNQMFNGTLWGPDAQGPGAYAGSLARAKRYGQAQGYDVWSKDPNTRRDAFAKSLHGLKNADPNNLSLEQQRIHNWLNTAAKNYTNNNQQPDDTNDHNSNFYKDVLQFATDDTLEGLVQNNNLNMNKTASTQILPFIY